MPLNASGLCPICDDKRQGRLCGHGKPAAACSHCLEAADHAFDAAREDRMFGRG